MTPEEVKDLDVGDWILIDDKGIMRHGEVTMVSMAPVPSIKSLNWRWWPEHIVKKLTKEKYPEYFL